MKRQKGFTLIELLVVISIIAILVALLLPALSSAREAGQGVACGNKQRQLSIAVNQHMFEQDGKLPWMWVNQAGVNNQGASLNRDGIRTWRAEIWPYVNNQANLYDCPSEENEKYENGWNGASIATILNRQNIADEWQAQSGYGAAFAHWEANNVAGRAAFARGGGSIVRESEMTISQPARVITFGDGNTAETKYAAPDTRYRWWIWSDQHIYNTPGFNRADEISSWGHDRHSRRANYSFVDGHVAMLDAGDIPCAVGECWWSIELNAHK